MKVTICKHSYWQLRSILHSSPTLCTVTGAPLRVPPLFVTPLCPAHAPAASSRAFTDSQIIYGRVPAGALLNVLLRKPLMREKALFLHLLSDAVLWDNIGHYEVWGIFHGTP